MRLNPRLLTLRSSCLFIFCLFGVSATAWSQRAVHTEVNISGKRVHGVHPSLEERFKHYEVYEVNQDLSTATQLEDGQVMTLELKLSETMHWDLELVPNHLFASDVRIEAATDDGYERLEKPECNTFMGSPASGTDKSVRINLSDQGFWGILPKSDVPGEVLYIEPMRNFDAQSAAHQYVVYAPEDVVEEANTKCLHDHVKDARQTVVDHGMSGRSGGSGDCFGIEIAVAVDYSAYDFDNESTTNVMNRYTGVLNVVDGYYDVFDIDFMISGFFISESPQQDPWTPSTDANLLLDEFEVWANSYFGEYDIASLWTYRQLINLDGNVLGGIAQGKPCYIEKGHNVMKVGSYISSVILAPLWSHEIGHNLEATHDPATAPYIMRQSGNLYQITEFSTKSLNDISDYIHTHDCVSCIAPDLVPLLSPNDEGLTLDWGSQYTLDATVRNIGVLTAGGSVLRCYWSDDAQWDQGDAFIGQSSFPSINRDTEVSRQVTVQIPAGSQSQIKYIICVADATNLVDETSGEDNNAMAIPVILTDPNNPHDLEVSIDQQAIPGSIRPGSPAFQTPIEVNLSGASIPSSQNLTSYGVKLFLSTEETVVSGSIELGSVAVNNTQPIATQVIPVSTSIPSTMPFGKYNLIAQVDVNDDVNESNEFNNETIARIQLAAPDLIMADLHAVLPGSKTSFCHVSGKVRNQNDLAAGASSLGISLIIQADGSKELIEVPINNYPVPSIAAQDFHPFLHTFYYAPPANHQITGVKYTADVLNAVDEEFEDNNIGKFIVTPRSVGQGFSIDGSETEGVRLYPNPAADQVSLRFEQSEWASEEVEVSILNSSGQQMLVLNVPGNTFYADLDVSDFPAGAYQIVIRQHDRWIYREMLLKQ